MANENQRFSVSPRKLGDKGKIIGIISLKGGSANQRCSKIFDFRHQLRWFAGLLLDWEVYSK